MSTRRYSDTRLKLARNGQRGPNGRLICRCGCGREVEPPRKTWFSQQCVDGYLIRKSGTHLRSKTFERDGGVCAVCGVDTDRVQRRRWRVIRKLTDAPINSCLASMCGKEPRQIWGRDKYGVTGVEEINRRWKAKGWPTNPTTSHWEADHIVEVVRGGGSCGLDNIQTLCRPCHLAKTRRLHRDRAKRAKKQ